MAAIEEMFGNPSLPSLSRGEKSHQIGRFIAQGKQRGMTTMDASRRRPDDVNTFEAEAAREKPHDKDEMWNCLSERGRC